MAYYSPETIEAVKSISALQYMMDHESYNLKKVGRIYQLRDHDSCYFSNGFWRWASQGKGGKSALQFLQEVEGLEFIEAMERLCTLYNITQTDDRNTMNTFRQMNEKRQKALLEAQKEDSNREFTLPKPAENNKRVYAYLRSRGISDGVIRYCIDKGFLYQDETHGNCVFVGYDNEDNPRYAGLRSTGYKSFKGDAPGSNKAYSFRLCNNDSDTVHLFEAPIDLLSYATYMELKGYDFKKTNLLALSGVALPRGDGNTSLPGAIETLLEGRGHIRRFSIHFDNDTTGVAAANALGSLLLSKGYETSISKVPEECGKDMNDYLNSILAVPRKKLSK